MHSTQFAKLFTVLAVGAAVTLGVVGCASPNQSTPAVAAAHTDRVKVQPDDGVAKDADAASKDVRENPNGDEEEREATVAHPGATTGSCGVERWSVKTGTDADAGKITLGRRHRARSPTWRGCPRPVRCRPTTGSRPPRRPSTSSR